MTRPSGVLSGEALDESIGLEDANVGEAIEDRRPVAAALHEPGAPEDGKMLAHVRDLTTDLRRQVANGKLAGSQRLEHAETFRVGERTTNRGIPLTVEFARGRDGQDVQHHDDDVTVCANTQVLSGRGPAGILRRMTSADGLVGLDEIRTARERIGRSVHRTPM